MRAVKTPNIERAPPPHGWNRTLASIELENLTKVFKSKRREVYAVRDLNLSIESGELVVLVGPSGCGKTSTLRMIAGLEEITSGCVRLDKRVVNDVPPRDRDIAMVFQNLALYPHMTVFDNMSFGLRMRKVVKSEIKQRVHASATLLGIVGLLSSKPAALSGGEKQRVALGRAIVRDPKLFLLDEPLSSLDAKLRTRMRGELKALQRKLATTMLYVTHDQEEAMTLGDRIAVMHEGMVRQVGTPMEVYNRPADRFVAEFVGNPGMNLLRVEIEDGGEVLHFAGDREISYSRDDPASSELPAGSAILGFRPEQVRILLSGSPDAQNDSGQSNNTSLEFRDLSVQLVEPLGESAIVHLGGPGNDSIIARTSPSISLDPSQRVTARIDASQVHFFADDDAGRRIVLRRT